jgi:hypothetical protein
MEARIQAFGGFGIDTAKVWGTGSAGRLAGTMESNLGGGWGRRGIKEVESVGDNAGGGWERCACRLLLLNWGMQLGLFGSLDIQLEQTCSLLDLRWVLE